MKKVKRYKPYLRLKWVRITHCLTQKQIAEILGVRATTYNRWEVGAVHMPRIKWYKLLSFLGVNEVDIPAAKDADTDVTPHPIGRSRENGGTVEEDRAWRRSIRRNVRKLGYDSVEEAEEALRFEEVGDEVGDEEGEGDE